MSGSPKPCCILRSLGSNWLICIQQLSHSLIKSEPCNLSLLPGVPADSCSLSPLILLDYTALPVSTANKSLEEFQALPSQYIPSLSCFLVTASPDQCFVTFHYNWMFLRASKRETSTESLWIAQPGSVHDEWLEGSFSSAQWVWTSRIKLEHLDFFFLKWYCL